MKQPRVNITKNSLKALRKANLRCLACHKVVRSKGQNRERFYAWAEPVPIGNNFDQRLSTVTVRVICEGCALVTGLVEAVKSIRERGNTTLLWGGYVNDKYRKVSKRN